MNKNQMIFNQKQLFSLFDSLPMCICYTDREKTYRFVNKTYEKWFGVKLEDIYGQHISTVIGEETYQKVLPNIERVLKGETRQFETELAYLEKKRYVSANLIPDKAENGEIRGYFASIEDITERKETENLYSTVINVMSEGILIYDTQGKIIASNPSATKILGLSQEELLGKNSYAPNWLVFDENYQEMPLEKLPLVKTLRTGNPCEGVIVGLKRPDQALIWLSINSHFLTEKQGVMVSFTDITQQKKVEDKLRQNELKLRQITNSIPGTVYQYKRNKKGEDKFLFMSDGIEKLYELSAEKVMKNARLMWDVLETEDIQNIDNSIDKVIENGQCWCQEYKIKTPSGKIKWIRGESIPYYQENGEIIWNGILTDITQQKNIEKQLKKALKNVSDIKFALDNVAIISITDLKGNIIYANDLFCQISGYSRSELMGKNHNIVNSGYHSQAFFQKLWETISQGKIWRGEMKNKTKNGDFYWVDNTIIPFLDEEKKPFQYISIRRDITQKKQQEKALQKSEARNRALLQAIPDLIISADQNGVFTDCKTTKSCPTFVPPEVLIGKKPIDIFEPFFANQIMETYAKALNSGEVKTLEYQLEINGEMRDYEARIVATETKEIISIIRDFTMQKRYEKMLNHAKQKAETANHTKSIFLANMSHELRSPLNAILGFSQLLSHSNNLTEKQQKQLHIINNSGEYLLGLINDILDLSKIESGSISINNTEFNLIQKLQDTQELLAIKAQDKALNFQFIIDPNLPIYILGDRLKIRQILVNLISNAIKYTNEGYVICECKYQLTKNNQHLMIITVTDTGRGIKPEEINKIFQPFIQAKSGQDSQVGTGLGLAITEQYVKLLGGKITVKSEVNKGSIFTVKLPIFPLKNEQSFCEIKPKKIIGLVENSPLYKILIVDDKQDNRYLIREFMEILNFSIQEAKNGQEAIKKAKSFQPHLIFMDLKMPILDGFEAAKIIKQKRQENEQNFPKIIALTASAFIQDKQKILTVCDTFLMKPINEAELFREIATQLKVSYQFQAENKLLKNSLPSSEDLSLLSSQWLQDLQTAILNLDHRKIQCLIEQIKPITPCLAEELLKYSYQYNYELILKIISDLAN